MEDQVQITLESLEPVSSFESFTIGAEEAAEILGVNRTRLSQLTTKGVFAYERRKIENHNRLFYRLNDLLSYQRDHTYGNTHARVIPKERAFTPAVPLEKETKSNKEEIEKETNQKWTLSTPFPNQVQTQLKKSSALELREKQDIKTRLENLESQMNHLQGMIEKCYNLFENIQIHLNRQDLKIDRQRLDQHKLRLNPKATEAQAEKSFSQLNDVKKKIKFRKKNPIQSPKS